MTITYHQARKLAILELLDSDEFTAREIADADRDETSNLYVMLDALTERYFEEEKEKEAEQASKSA